MLGDLELKIDDWVKAKDTFRAAKDATDGKDSYATLALVRMFLIYTILWSLAWRHTVHWSPYCLP